LTRAILSLGLPLRKEAEVTDLRACKEARGGVRTSRNARAAADALGGVHRAIGDLLRDRDLIGFGSRTRPHGDVATRLDDAIEGAAIDRQILDDGEGRSAEGLDPDLVGAVDELPHVKLTG